jgi:hypothetical protein
MNKSLLLLIAASFLGNSSAQADAPGSVKTFWLVSYAKPPGGGAGFGATVVLTPGEAPPSFADVINALGAQGSTMVPVAVSRISCPTAS